MDLVPILPQHDHWWQMFQALVAPSVFPLFNGDPPGAIPDAVLIKNLYRLALNSAVSAQPNTNIITTHIH